MSLTREQLIEQEKRIQLESFSSDTAWLLGSYLHQIAYERDLAVAIEIFAFEQVLYSSERIGSFSVQQKPTKKMREAVLFSEHCSHYLALNRIRQVNTAFDVSRFDVKGGAFPLRLKKGPLIGVISCSGLTSIDSHNLVVEALEHIISQQALID